MTKPRATWVLWLKISMAGKEWEWKPLCSADPGYYFSAGYVMRLVADTWRWPKNMYRILPAGRKPKGAK